MEGKCLVEAGGVEVDERIEPDIKCIDGKCHGW
jgi:hypothetical protein